MYSANFLYDECCEEFEKLYFCHSNKDKNVSCEGTFHQDEDFIEHANFSLETAKSNLLPYDVYDHLIVLNPVKKKSSQQNDQQFQEDFVTPNCYEAYDPNEIFRLLE
jgi:hypothetical protein